MAKPKMSLLALICVILFRLGDRHRSANSAEIATVAPCKAMVPIRIGLDMGNERRNKKKKKKIKKKKERKFCLTHFFVLFVSLLLSLFSRFLLFFCLYIAYCMT